MRLRIPLSAARAATLAAVVARVFLGLSLQAPDAHNGAWLAALVGGLLALPLVNLMELMRRRSHPMLCAALLLSTAADAAGVLSDTVRSAGYLALNRVAGPWLLLPVCAAVLWSIAKNGDSVGYAAMAFARLFPLLLMPVALLQLPHYRPAWLLPLLGDGWRGILEDGVRVAGWIASACAVLMVSGDDDGTKKPRRTPSAMLAAGIAVAALLIVLRLMMTPTQLQRDGWSNRLDALLTNGRAPLYLQLPMIALWYAGMLHLLACEGFACAALLQGLFPRLGGMACAVAAVAAVALASGVGAQDFFAPWRYIVLAVIAAVAALLPDRRKGGATS